MYEVSLSAHCYSCLDDVDDEVRDRAIMYLKLMEDEKPNIAKRYITDGMEEREG